MDNRASIAEWRELYSVGLELVQMKPWQYFWDMDLIAVILQDHNEPYYFSIMGKNEECYGIGCYLGPAVHRVLKMDSYADFFSAIIEQDGLMMFLGNRDEVTKENYKIIRELGLKFRGKNQWMYFQRYKPMFLPYILDRDEVLLLTEGYRQLSMALRALLEQRIQPDFANGEMLLRHFDKERQLWLTYGTKAFFPPETMVSVTLRNPSQIWSLRAKPMTNLLLEFDMQILDIPMTDDAYDRPFYPTLLILADRASGFIIAQHLASPDERIQTTVDMICDFINANGKPDTIYITSDTVKEILSDLCDSIGVMLKKVSKLTAVNCFMNEMNNILD